MKKTEFLFFIIVMCLIFFLFIAIDENKKLQQNLRDCNQDYIYEYSNLEECQATKEICYKVLMENEQELEICNQLKNCTETDYIKIDESIICPTEKCKKIGYSCLQIYDFENIPYAFQCVKKMITD